MIEVRSDLEMPPPKFATARDESRPTIGTRQGRFARQLLGQPLMPWQQLVSDVAGEVVRDEETGLWVPAHPLVVVTVQRQAGKSHLAMAKNGERCFSVPGWRAWYTAQTGQDARDQFLKFDEENIGERALRSFVRTYRGRGEEKLLFANKSEIRPHPPTEEKLHGKQSDSNDIDEAWAFSSEQGAALMQAIGPTQNTRPLAQTWIWSAGGTATSTWLAELVARGRGGDPSMAYFEWGIPDDLPLDDLAAIASYNPAYGHSLTLRALRNLRAKMPDDAEFARAAGNRWTEIVGGAITGEVWQSVRHHDPIPETARVGFGAARSVDGSHVAIVAAADVDGITVVELLDVVSPIDGADHAAGWARGESLAVAQNGPSATLHRDLVKLGARRLMAMNTADESAAVTHLLDGLPSRRIRFRPHPDLDAAVKVAGLRNTGDGGKAWARLKAGAPIAAIEAAGWAVWALTHAAKPVGRPRIITAA